MHLLETKVLELIGEEPDSPDVFLDTDAGMAPVRDSLNDAIQEIAMLEGNVKRQYFIPLRKGQMVYRFILNYGYLGWVSDAWLVDKKYRLEQTGVGRLTRYDPRWMVTSADPRAYFPIGTDAICVYPKPSGSNDVLEVTIAEIPLEYDNENDKVLLKDSFAYAAVNYAVSEFWASRGDAQEATRHFDMYLDAMKLRRSFNTSPQGPRNFATSKTSNTETP